MPSTVVPWYDNGRIRGQLGRVLSIEMKGCAWTASGSLTKVKVLAELERRFRCPPTAAAANAATCILFLHILC